MKTCKIYTSGLVALTMTLAFALPVLADDVYY